MMMGVGESEGSDSVRGKEKEEVSEGRVKSEERGFQIRLYL
jgi:hypothetical protein